MSAEYSAAIAASVLFFCFAAASVVSKKVFGFKLYLLLGLSTLLRGVGFACRAAQDEDPLNTDLAAASLVFRQAGFGISIAVLCILSGCWFKNADNQGKPPRSWPTWSVGVRLLIAPVIVFGPIMGIVAAILIFGKGDPSSIQTGNKIRTGSSWAFLGVVSLLHILANVAAAYVLRWQHAVANAANVDGDGPGGKPKAFKRSSSMQRLSSTLRLAARHAHSWVHMLQAQCLLLQVATIFRVVSLYHTRFSTDPNLFYTLQVLPELLYVLLLLLPTVMVRVGMVGHYPEFAAAVAEGQPYGPSAGAAPADGSGTGTKSLPGSVSGNGNSSGRASDVEAQ